MLGADPEADGRQVFVLLPGLAGGSCQLTGLVRG